METQRLWRLTGAAVVAAALLIPASSATADSWNDRTELTFSSPVMVPGETLQPGTYVFKLADTLGSRHVVQIIDKADGRMITTTQAVPVRREEPAGDTVLTFNPTERGIPAMKAWYYPNSSYGHEFIYPEEEARLIAQRSKSIVLSGDIQGSDLEKGTLRVYHPSGQGSAWQPDVRVAEEWETWRRSRQGVGADQTAPARAQDDVDVAPGDNARAPMMMSKFEGDRVSLDDLESSPEKYVGRRVSVDAEVEEVYGPRLFTIDEPQWGDLDGEILVYAPSLLAALVNDDDRITVTGTMKMIAMARSNGSGVGSNSIPRWMSTS